MGAARRVADTRPSPAPDDGASHRYLAYEPALDGVRALAIVAVLLFHIRPSTVRGGFLGVGVFFTLSGYLITSLLLGERRATSTVDVGRFWTRRLQRLAPAAIVVVVLCAAVTRTSIAGWGWKTSFAFSDAAAAMWSVMNWHVIALGTDHIFRLLGPVSPYWSLAVEEQFYAAIAVLFLVLRAARRPVAVLASVLTATWLASLAIAMTIQGSEPRLEFGTDVRAAELAAGALLAVVLSQRPHLVAKRRGWYEAGGWVALALVVVLLMRADLDPPWLLHGGFAVLSLVYVALILGLLAHGPLAAVFSWRPLVLVGRLSYSLYLVHWPIVMILASHRTGITGWPDIVLKVVVSFAAAIALHLLVEQPLRRRRASPGTIVAWWLGGTLAATAACAALLL